MIDEQAFRLLARVNPETAHRITIAALKYGLSRNRPPACDAAALRTVLGGLQLPNPLGMAAGFDKDGEIPDAILRLGFGFVEIGTVTPEPQPGNRRPRVFRLPQAGAIINRYGFNSQGAERVHARLARLRAQGKLTGIVGVNLGMNARESEPGGAYVLGIDQFHSVASYFVINISSPNTPGLRRLQQTDRLTALLDALAKALSRQRANAPGAKVPLFVKLSPDIGEGGLDGLARALRHEAVDGLVLTNTTRARDGVAGMANGAQSGGLSGVPLFERATIMLAKLRVRMGEKLPIIGVGGIAAPDQAIAKLEAGANALQLYTGLVYRGPRLVSEIIDALSQKLARDDAANVSEFVGSDVTYWAAKPLPDFTEEMY